MDDTSEFDNAEVLRHKNVVESDDLRSGIDVPIRKLFISNLAVWTTSNNLREYFSTYGDVESCRLRRNKGRRNYAFVTFTKIADAVKAMQDGSRKRLHHRDLMVNAAHSWHQPKSLGQRLYTAGRESNETSKRMRTELYSHEYLNDTENVSINILNDDCLRHIFLFLSIIDRAYIERVCTRWRDLIQDSYMIKTLDLSIWSSTWGFTYTRTIHTTLLRKILLKFGKFLTQINLNDRTHNLNLSTLTVIGELCPNLTSIDVTALTVCASGIRTLTNNCKNITKFNLGPSTYRCDDDLKCLFEQNQNLKYLTITNNDISGKCLLWLPEQTMHTIILDRCDYLEDHHLSMTLRKLEGLKHLEINECRHVTQQHTLQTVGQHCKNLRTLVFSEDFPSLETADVSYLIHLVNLQVLKITYNSDVSDDFLINLVQHCQQLTNIDITGCSSVSNVGLMAIATLVRLERLIVSYISRLSSNGLINVSGLKELECRKCWFTNRSITALIMSSPQLQLLDLSGCRCISNTTLKVAKDICGNRTNNVMLKMIIGGTAITKKDIDQERLPRLLHVDNVDLSDYLSDLVACPTSRR